MHYDALWKVGKCSTHASPREWNPKSFQKIAFALKLHCLIHPQNGPSFGIMVRQTCTVHPESLRIPTPKNCRGLEVFSALEIAGEHHQKRSCKWCEHAGYRWRVPWENVSFFFLNFMQTYLLRDFSIQWVVNQNNFFPKNNSLFRLQPLSMVRIPRHHEQVTAPTCLGLGTWEPYDPSCRWWRQWMITN